MYDIVDDDELSDYYDNPQNNKISCFSLFNNLFYYCYDFQKPKLVRQYNLIPHPIYYIKGSILEPFGNGDFIEAAVPYNWVPVFKYSKIIWYKRKELVEI
jgi:hypothetical protein